MQKGELNKVWLVAGIALVVVLVFLLVFFARKEVTAGKAVEVTQSLGSLGVGQFGIDPTAATANAGDEVTFTVRANAGTNQVDTLQLSFFYNHELMDFIGETLGTSAEADIISGAEPLIPGFDVISAKIFETEDNINLAYSSGGVNSFTDEQDVVRLRFRLKETLIVGEQPGLGLSRSGSVMMEGESPITYSGFHVDSLITIVEAVPIAADPAAGGAPTVPTLQQTDAGDLNLVIPQLPPGTFPIINWLVDAGGADGAEAESLAVLNMPFEAFSEDLIADGTEDTQTTYVKDYSGNNNHGTVTGATFEATGGYDGRGAYRFSGETEAEPGNPDPSPINIITVPHSDSLNPGAGSFTASLWVKPEGIALAPTGLVKKEGGSDYYIFELTRVGNGNNLMGYEVRDNGLVDGTDGNRFAGRGSTELTSGQWHHLVYVIDRDDLSEPIKMYLNGRKEIIVGVYRIIGTQIYENYMSALNEDISPTGPLVLGRHVNYFNGNMDDLQIYQRALSAEQIAAMYAEGIDSTDGIYDTIVSQEILEGGVWSAEVTFNGADGDVSVSPLILTSAGADCGNGAVSGQSLLCDACPDGEQLSGGVCAVMTVESLNSENNPILSEGIPFPIIPDTYACDNNGGSGVNPPLTISNIPDDTQSLAIIMEDTTNPTLHWSVWNIPVTGASYSINSPWSVPMEAVSGNNYLNAPSYAGPCPPIGDPAHTYVFNIYALNIMPDFQAGTQLTSSALEIAVASNDILAEAELSGTYNVLCAADNQCGDDETCNLITGLCSDAADLCAGIECEDNQQCQGGLCVPIASCDDGILNGNEEGMDCGGSSCPACTQTLSALDQPCVTGATCASGICTGGECSCAENYDRIATICRPEVQVDALRATIRNILTDNTQYPTSLHKISAIAREFKELMR